MLEVRIHLRMEEPIRRATVFLRTVERDVRVLEKLVAVHPVGGADGRANACAHDHTLPLDGVRRAYDLNQALRQSGNLLGTAYRAQEDRKLITPQTCYDVHWS